MPSTTPGAQLDLPALQHALARTADDDSLALVTPSEKLKRKKRGSQRQACACGKGVRGICRGRDAKPTLSGITLPFGKEGSVNYRLREQQLRAVMGASEFAKNKDRLMAAKEPRLHISHFPRLPDGKTRLTPSKHHKARAGSLVLRRICNANGPVSLPVDVDAEAEGPRSRQ